MSRSDFLFDPPSSMFPWPEPVPLLYAGQIPLSVSTPMELDDQCEFTHHDSLDFSRLRNQTKVHKAGERFPKPSWLCTLLHLIVKNPNSLYSQNILFLNLFNYYPLEKLNCFPDTVTNSFYSKKKVELKKKFPRKNNANSVKFEYLKEEFQFEKQKEIDFQSTRFLHPVSCFHSPALQCQVRSQSSCHFGLCEF